MKSLLQKMQDFEDNYYCKKCKTDECIHLRIDMNKKFEKEIEEDFEMTKQLSSYALKQEQTKK